jgi:prepilin-type N-terminal cleavage/methylation domain-containing protein
MMKFHATMRWVLGCRPLAVSHRRRTIAPSRRLCGFTLVELLAAMVVLATMGSAAMVILSSATKAYHNAATQAQLYNELGTAMSRIDKELRQIALKSGTTAPNITSVSASSITWNTNSTLTLSGTNLMFTDAGAAAAILLGDVTAFTVQTYDESNAALAASLSGSGCDPIRRIQIQITMQRNGVTESLRNKIFLRCMVEGAGQ